jgi:hypothetical protein
MVSPPLIGSYTVLYPLLLEHRGENIIKNGINLLVVVVVVLVMVLVVIGCCRCRWWWSW